MAPRRVAIAASMTLAVMLAGACGQAPLPSRLAGLVRSRVLVGRQASRLLARMHGREVAPADTSVAEYGRSGSLRVWMSRYPDGATAQRTLAGMLSGMRQGKTPFVQPSEDRFVPGRWTTVGLENHHVIWVSGRTLYWLEGPPDLVFRAADELPVPTVGRLA